MENEFIEDVENEVIEIEPVEVVNNDDIPLDDSSNLSSSQQSLEELLREYFSGSRDLSLDPEEDLSREGASERASEGASDIDYTDLLNEILSASEDSASYESSIMSYLEDYEQNNTLTSELDSISLTNFLLLFVSICILALGAINFSRRIL